MCPVTGLIGQAEFKHSRKPRQSGTGDVETVFARQAATTPASTVFPFSPDSQQSVLPAMQLRRWSSKATTRSRLCFQHSVNLPTRCPSSCKAFGKLTVAATQSGTALWHHCGVLQAMSADLRMSCADEVLLVLWLLLGRMLPNHEATSSVIRHLYHRPAAWFTATCLHWTF